MFRFSQLSPTSPRLMGIVNITPDSFSDGILDPAAAADHARTLAAQGAAILDLGAEASSFFRPGILPVPAAEQLRRLLPVLALLRDLPPAVVLSVDTRSAEVARAVLDAGAAIINDISAGTSDPALFAVVAQRRAAIILMHMSPGYPATPPADDPDILATVADYLLARARAARAAGIAPDQIALDPGLGFGKTMADNWRLALRSPDLAAHLAPYPLVLGASRKRFLETPPPPDTPFPMNWSTLVAGFLVHQAAEPTPAHSRDAVSATLALVTRHVIHRLHNVSLATKTGPYYPH